MLQNPLQRITVRKPKGGGAKVVPNWVETEIFWMLINRNITVNGHRTSVRLEPEFWAGLTDIAKRENLTIDELCTEVDRSSGGLSRTAAIRVFITSYMVRLAQQTTEQLARPFATVAGSTVEAQSADQYAVATPRFRAAG